VGGVGRGAERSVSEREQLVAQALAAVPDPCSVAAGAPLGLLDMGLVRSYEIDAADRLTVVLDVTSPACMMAGHFVADAETRLRQIPGIREVTVSVQPTLEWSEARLTPHGRAVLERRRKLARERIRGPR
jgi:metal-sulfur cluster biosynthetic enzyme